MGNEVQDYDLIIEMTPEEKEQLRNEAAELKLTGEEVDELSKPIKGSGGFQSLFRRLCCQLDEDDVLTISPQLATVILRYASGRYGQGGFQDRLKRLPRILEAAQLMESAGDVLPDEPDDLELVVGPADDAVVEDNSGDYPEETGSIRYSITNYGIDFDVDGLVKRIGAGDVYIPPFQRGFVWRLKQASRFIESLLLGLPVPGIFLSKETETKRYLVIDGQQRLRTLQYFYSGEFARSRRSFALVGVGKQFEGLTYATLDDEDRRQLDNSFIHATVVQQEKPSDDQSSIYHIFERLNTGGTLLHPQEIRGCIYYGALESLLRELNDDAAWRSIFGPTNPRMRDQELILRFVALYFGSGTYRSPMVRFLNEYMRTNRNLTAQSADEIKQAFIATVNCIHAAKGEAAFTRVRVLNAAVFDAVMVGLARRLSRGPVVSTRAVAEAYDSVVNKPEFIAVSQTSTASEENVGKRIELATQAFANVT